MKIGVTGATGHLGRIVVKKLKEKTAAENIVALVRTPHKAADLEIEARTFDYNKPESLVTALKGIDRLLLISGNEIGQRVQQHINVINAAKKAGVKWIVYTSLLRADTSSLSLALEHLPTETAIKTSGLQYTILRNGWYSENYIGSVLQASATGVFMGSAGNGKISSASRADYAEAAAIVLTNEIHQGKIYELAGDEAYTLSDLAAEFSRQSGKNVVYKNLPESEHANILKNSGLPEKLALTIAGWDVSVSKGDLFDETHQLSKLIERPTTPLSQAVRETFANSNK